MQRDPNLEEQVRSRMKKGFTRGDKKAAGSAKVVSTGSTLLDLAISGGRFSQGGIPGGILVEIFGPASCGKTVILCEIAGAVQRQGGKVLFKDPEARLNAQFAQLFGFRVQEADYSQPNTVPELFEPVRKWQPKAENDAINGIFADSLAALSTETEMADADKYGMRRAKEFSEECRKTCRILAQKGFLMVCSNQVRQNIDAGPFAEKYISPGGVSIGFYSSLRLRCHSPRKIPVEKTVGRRTVRRVIGVETTVEVYKSSIWQPYHSAPLRIIYSYGIDDVSANLDYLKSTTGASSYMLDGRKLGNALARAVRVVEEEKLERLLKAEVITLWNETEAVFKSRRQAKRR